GHNFELLQGDWNIFEKTLPELVKVAKQSSGRIYIIAYSVNDVETRNHEIMHYHFGRSPELRQEIIKIWNAVPAIIREKVEKFLSSKGYHDHTETVVDEFYAYLLTDKRCSFGLQK